MKLSLQAVNFNVPIHLGTRSSNRSLPHLDPLHQRALQTPTSYSGLCTVFHLCKQ
jgi:hypothetical protein